MNLSQFIPENKWHLLISASAILLILCSLLAISISMHTAYMWLIVVFMTVLFLTTFTCSERPEIDDITQDDSFVQVTTVCHSQPVWIVDVPPSYAHATGLPTGNTPPPSYSKVPFLPPPPYKRKADIPHIFRYGRHGSIPNDHSDIYRCGRHGSIQSDHPDVFRCTRHGSIQSEHTDIFRCGRHGSVQSEHLAEIISSRFGLRHGSISSVQTLHFNVIENH